MTTDGGPGDPTLGAPSTAPLRRRQRSGVPPLAKYLLFQIPGWVFLGILLTLLVRHAELSPRLAFALFGAWLVKDFALYPILRVGYQRGSPDGTGSLVGALGTTRQRLDPEGYVRVGSELWRARLADGLAPIEAGAAIRVLEVDDLTLRVEPAA